MPSRSAAWDTRTPVKGRWIELGRLAARFMIYFGLIFWLLPFGMAWAFIGVQLAVFGLYMGATFSPNHKGMPPFRAAAPVHAQLPP
jgi:hypothetical protein